MKPHAAAASALAVLFLLIAASVGAATLTKAHHALSSYGFPAGLLPSSVRSYTINSTTDVFSVDLGSTCKITLPPDNYLATYSKVITGKIVDGKIADLDGIKVRALFRNWAITGIRASDDDLVFEVGMVTAKYPKKSFVEAPYCEGSKPAAAEI
ncbi:hypothetical protein MLD38_014372 [Melastoma candidum]|uniref:Uncharacterized protein n=1 Tax=Melastoma candidum TaxID=119954 RepID=A0ACB9REG1_9MYRT|nr:hypothetical protein MLD38_014372 [Melastoma candidum]